MFYYRIFIPEFAEEMSLYSVDETIPDTLAGLIEPFTVGCRAARRGMIPWCNIDLLGLTFSQQSIIGSGGYMPEDVCDVQNIMASNQWNLESIITHEFPLEQLETAIRTASAPNHSGSVAIKM